MKKLFLAAALSAAALAVPALAQEYTAPPVAAKPAGGPVKNASYVIDPTHTFVMYELSLIHI